MHTRTHARTHARTHTLTHACMHAHTIDITFKVVQQTPDMVLEGNPIHCVAMCQLGKHAFYMCRHVPPGVILYIVLLYMCLFGNCNHTFYICRHVPSGVCYITHVCNSIRKSRPTGTYISSQLCNTHLHTQISSSCLVYMYLSL